MYWYGHDPQTEVGHSCAICGREMFGEKEICESCVSEMLGDDE